MSDREYIVTVVSVPGQEVRIYARNTDGLDVCIARGVGGVKFLPPEWVKSWWPVLTGFGRVGLDHQMLKEINFEPLDRGVSMEGNSTDTEEDMMGAYHGKTYYQESVDSRAALGLALIAVLLMILGLTVLAVLWLVL